MRTLLASIIFAAFATGAAAQTKPDFTGGWTTEPDPAVAGARAGGAAGGGRAGGGRGGAPASMGSGWGSTITVTQDAARLTVQYSFFGRGDMQAPIKYVFALDGSPTKNSVMMGRGIQEQTSTAAWTAEKLVIVTRYTIPNPAGTGAPLPIEVTQALSLESPTSLVVETTRPGAMGGAASTTRTVYRKV